MTYMYILMISTGLVGITMELLKYLHGITLAN
jgi:hypothetical protein